MSTMRTRILGLAIDNLSMRHALDKIEALMERDAPGLVFFLNAHCANLAYLDRAYRDVLESADLVLPDGSGMALAGRMLKKPIRENVNGTDLFPLLAGRLAASGRRVFLLGARPGIAKDVAGWLGRNHAGVKVVGHHSGYFKNDEEPALLNAIAQSKADLLLVAMGVPRQELWLAEHLHATGAKVGIAVGGLFDFYSGRISRAPKLMRRLGIEWFWRFLQEPGRMWKRYFLGNFIFVYRIWRERVGRRP